MRRLLWCLLALVVASCGGDDEPTPEPLPVVSAEIVFVPCVSKSEMVLDVMITSDRPVSLDCSAGRNEQGNRMLCRGEPDPLVGEWTGRVFCATGSPDPNLVNSYGCIVRDAETGRLADDVYADPAPGFAPQEERQVYDDLCGL